MNIDIHTLAVILGITGLLQSAVLFAQFKINKMKSGPGWWCAGSSLFALAFILNYLRDLPFLGTIAIVGNNIVFVAGLMAFYVGVLRFFGKSERRGLLAAFFALVALVAIYFSYFHDDLAVRRINISVAMTAISLLIAHAFVAFQTRQVRASSNFLAAVFVFHALFWAWPGFSLAFAPAEGMFSSTPSQILTYMSMLITGNLWTFGFILLVNQRLNAETREDEENLRLIFNTSPDAALITRMSDGLFVDINETFTAVTGYTRAELVGKTTLQVNIWRDSAERRRFTTELMQKGRCENMELALARKDGSPIIGLVSAKVMKLQGEPHIISVTQDITERMRTQAALRESEEKLRAIFSVADIGITIMDRSGRYIMFNAWWLEKLGYSREEMYALSHLDITHPDDRETSLSWFQKIIAGSVDAYRIEKRFIKKDSTVFWGDLSVSVIKDGAGNVSTVIGIVADITERKETERQVQDLLGQLEAERNYAQRNAMTDGLTGLSNRRHFDESLNVEFFRLKRFGGLLSLIMLDIDHFKKYNDHYGHVAGDDCLRKLGATLKAIVGRVPDIVARYGGEEFVAILPDTNAKGALALAERIRASVEALELPHAASETGPFVTVSLGVTTVDTSRTAAPEQAVSLADEALYRAKRGGRNRVDSSLESGEFAGVEDGGDRGHGSFVQLVWHAGDECGNATIDRQHRALFDTSNRLLAAVIEGRGKEECLSIINALLEEITGHFHDELAILDAVKYPLIREHRESHARLAAMAVGLAEKYGRGELTLGELFSFLAYDVVAQHLFLEDRKFFEYV